MGAELLDAIRNAETNDEVKVLVIKGLERSFSAGGDVGMLHGVFESERANGYGSHDGEEQHHHRQAQKMDKLVITSVAGSVAGAGVSLALSGDFMICADNAKFILAFVNLGLVPDMGLTYLLSKTIGPARTTDLAVTGRPVDVANSTTGVLCSAARHDIRFLGLRDVIAGARGLVGKLQIVRVHFRAGGFADRVDSVTGDGEYPCAGGRLCWVEAFCLLPDGNHGLLCQFVGLIECRTPFIRKDLMRGAKYSNNSVKPLCPDVCLRPAANAGNAQGLALRSRLSR